MKLIKYQIPVPGGDGEIRMEKTIRCADDTLAANVAVAEKESADGTYLIEDDDTVASPTQLDMIEAQVAYTAMMTDTLLEV